MASAPDKVPVHDALSPGTRLDEFEIVRVLGTGGFGIVYLARDHVLLRDVAIKEFMPAALAGRGEGVTVSLRSAAFAETFAKGLESFLSEARLLASFDHPSLVKVHRFWRGNATAYMAMQYYPGPTLKEARSQMPAAPGAAWLGAFVHPLLGALELLHGQGVFHRDISPDNILMLADGQPVLLDLGSARRVVANGPQSFTAHLKPQFAPLEQYADEAGMQGPWTDLYALGATLHFVLTGRPPTPSVVRAARDTLPTLASKAGSFPAVPTRWLASIDWTLALAPEERPQDVAAIRRALSGELAPPPPSPRSSTAAAPARASNADSAASEVPVQAAEPESAALASADATPARIDTGLPARRSGPGRGAFLGAALSLAVMGVAALGWGAYALDHPASALPVAAALAVQPPHAAPRLSAPGAALPAPGLSPAAALPAPVLASGADPVSLRTTATAPPAASLPQASTPRMEAVATEESAWILLASTTGPSPAQDRSRTTRAKPRTAATRVKAAAQDRKDACTGSGFVASAMCVLHPCKSPRMRSSSQCVARLQAEEVRLQRVARE